MSDDQWEWDWTSVSGIASAIVGGGTPSRDVSAYWGGGIPWVTPGELTKLDSKYLRETLETISPDLS